LEKGVLVLAADGKRINVEASDANLAKMQCADREGLREYHDRQRLAAELNPRNGRCRRNCDLYPTSSAAAPTPGAAPAGSSSSRKNEDFDAFNQARAKKEGELARLAELDRLEREGALVVHGLGEKAAAARVAVAITQGLDQLSPRLAASWPRKRMSASAPGDRGRACGRSARSSRRDRQDHRGEPPPQHAMPDGGQLFAGLVAKALRPRPRVNVWQWADRERYSGFASSPEPGKWRTSRVPFAREIMEELSPTRRRRR
jgi:hypothetical protein